MLKSSYLLCNYDVMICLAPLSHQKEATPDQYEVLLTDHLLMKKVYPDGRGVFQDDCAPSAGFTE